MRDAVGQLLPHLNGIEIEEVVDADCALVIVARIRSHQAGCQACAVPSSRVHSRYRRTLADASVAGRPTRIVLWVRRFFCENAACEAKTFAEQVDGLTRRWSRVSEGLRQMLTTVGLALAGRAGARLAATLGMPASRHRLIRLVRALPDPPVGEVAVLGVDDSTNFSELGQLLQTKLYTGSGGSVYLNNTYETDTGRTQTSTVSRTQVSPNELAKVTYQYDHSGNLTKLTDAPAGGTTDTQCFRQDSLGRLTEAWTPASNDCAANPTVAGLGGPAPYWQSATYDRSGSRKTFTDRTPTLTTSVSYTVRGVGQTNAHAFTSTTTTAGSGSPRTDNYTYDTAGNTLTRPGATAGSTQNLTWDHEGKLKTVTEGTTSTTFLYDADGNRLLRRDAKGTTLYLGAIEVRYDKATSTASATRFYAHVAGTIALRVRAGLSWLGADHQGTSNITITAGTNQSKIRRQTPFGGLRGTVPATWPSEKGFVGGDNDPTGMVHLGAREYDPKVGRFISVDPILDLNDPQQLHGYAYSENNPINRSDPSGLLS